MAEGWLLTPEPRETVLALLPRGINIDSSQQHGGAVRYVIVGRDIVKGQGYHLVSTDGPLLRCIELVENDFEADPLGSAAETQPRKKPA